MKIRRIFFNINDRIAKTEKYNFAGKIKKSDSFLVFVTFFFIALILVTTTKGSVIEPSSSNIYNKLRDETMPFELSPERGRYALLTSVVENHSVFFSKDTARYVMPDLGYYDGKYVSLFPPGVSYLSVPFYNLGKLVGYPQYFSFLTSSFMAFMNCLLIYLITKKLTGNFSVGLLSSLIFIFGTTAFSYSTTLYQHHFVSFFILSGLYLLFFKNIISNILIFFIVGILFFIEYQSALFYLPILLMYFLNNIRIREMSNKIVLSVNIKIFIGLLLMIFSFIPFFYYNKITYGKYFQLAGTVQDAKNATEDPNTGDLIIPNYSVQNTSATGFFHMYRLPKSMYVLLSSKDRGVLYFSSVIIFSLFGFIPLWKKNITISIAVISISLTVLVLYGMWGDPWGGWAFGTRYLIPAFAVLSIPLGVAINEYGKKWYFGVALIATSAYSIFINLSGALTTNQIPPSVESDSIQYPDFTFIHNIDMIFKGKTSSFVYKTFVNDIDFHLFFSSIYLIIIILMIINYMSYIRIINYKK